MAADERRGSPSRPVSRVCWPPWMSQPDSLGRRIAGLASAGSLVVAGIAGLEDDDPLTLLERSLGGEVLDGGEGGGPFRAEAQPLEAGGAGGDRRQAVLRDRRLPASSFIHSSMPGGPSRESRTSGVAPSPRSTRPSKSASGRSSR